MDEAYNKLVLDVLKNGNYKPNRTSFDTLSKFGYTHKIDISESVPVTTTKKFYWNSFIHEFIWYLSGDSHIKTLQEETSIWDDWSEDGLVETSYARFWRRFPLAKHTVKGEAWADETDKSDWLNDDGKTFDQIQYIIDMLSENPSSRRIILNAWHPGNAAVSKLPPCHFTAVFNVQNGDTLNCHLTQRSGDIALGIPFNITGYSLLTHLLANQTGLKPGTFSHTIADAHIYCGDGKRGEWYGDNIETLQTLAQDNITSLQTHISENAPPEETQNSDHIPGLIEQVKRTPHSNPTIEYPENKDILELTADDFSLTNYTHEDAISFAVAE